VSASDLWTALTEHATAKASAFCKELRTNRNVHALLKDLADDAESLNWLRKHAADNRTEVQWALWALRKRRKELRAGGPKQVLLTAKAPKPSAEFLKQLPQISRCLSGAQIRECYEPWPGARASDDPAADGATNMIELCGVRPRHLLELAQILQLAREGVDARLLFGQKNRKKPSNWREQMARATAYWMVRAQDPSSRAGISLAEYVAGSMFGGGVKRAYIRKLAQKYKESSFKALETPVDGDQYDLRNQLGLVVGDWPLSVSKAQIAALRAHLAKKSGRRNVDKWVGGKYPRLSGRA
jgi:hypothetical protein